MEIVEIKIGGIHCGGCINGIETRLLRNGVLRFDLDLATYIAKILYEETLTNPQKIVAEITALGYQAKVIR